MNINSYRVTLDQLKPVILRPSKDIRRTLSELSMGSHVPLIAMLMYATRKDVLGPLPELMEAIENIKLFYKYGNIGEWEDLEK